LTLLTSDHDVKFAISRELKRLIQTVPRAEPL